ncbi:response regulator [Haloarcula litorea]|uniref:response regulator n=1 Tax=Haloarcula litorea TaxID=3032579 RepID=UPI0023E85979|nr:response regulator [Halomicroarcula sp. GDY20]
MVSLTVDEVTVLHVDDEPGFAEMVAEFLEREDDAFSVQTTARVTEALNALGETEVDCIVSDYDMPDRDGLEFLEVVRDDYPDLPFILFTGRGSEEIASRAISAGVTEYLQKDGGTEQYAILANRIRNTVRTSRAETAVSRTEDRYHNLVDTAPIPIVLFDEDRRALYANDRAVEFLNADAEADVVGRTMESFLHPDDRARAGDRFERLMREATSLPEREFRVRALDGEIKRAKVATAPGHYRGERVAQAMVYR